LGVTAPFGETLARLRNGKMKSTLKRELKAREAVKMETIKVSSASQAINPSRRLYRGVADEVVKGPDQLLNASWGLYGCTCLADKSASVWKAG